MSASRFVGLLAGILFAHAVSADTGDAGSKVESFQVRLDKFELKREEGNYITVYSGSEFLETIGTGQGSIVGTLQGVMPPPGTYTGYRVTLGAFRVKATLVQGLNTYYTTAQTISFVTDINSHTKSQVWPLTSEPNAYGTVTILGNPGATTVDFPTPLSISGDKDVSLVWIGKRGYTVVFDAEPAPLSFPNNVTWIRDDEIRALLPHKPSRLVQFKLSTNSGARENTVSFFLDSQGVLLGGYCYRPSFEKRAFNCDALTTGSVAGESFDQTFSNGDYMGTPLHIQGKYSCASNTYWDLSVTYGAVPQNDLATAGSVTCSDI